MTRNLEKLADCRRDLLLAEIAAWLHDFKKCSDNNVAVQAISNPNGVQGLQITVIDTDLITNPPNDIDLFNNPIPFNDLVKKGSKGSASDQSREWIVRAMRRCHHVAHIEKKRESGDDTGKQPADDTRLSSPFGFEGDPLIDLTNRLKSLPYNNLNDRKSFLKELYSAFVHAPGETRRPENDVTLWDWSFVVAALYKAAIARAVLTNDEVDYDQMRWKLFSVRFAGLEYIQNSHRISDLLARREVLQYALNNIKNILEEEYPLAMEAYHDENGSVYVFPDLENILACQNKNGDHLRDLILKSFGEGTVKDNPLLSLSGEVFPSLNEDDLSETWGMQLPEEEHGYKLPPLWAHIYKRVLLQSKASEVSKWWSSRSEELCVVCGLRPQGYGARDVNDHYRRKKARKSCPDTCQTCKAIERKVCWICEERRADRSMEWAKSLKNTIWVDEVADANGRIALIAGFFDSVHWIEGTMIETLAVDVDVGNGTAKTKNPSFARIRRVWETTRRFWQDILPTDQEAEISESVCGRELDRDTPGPHRLDIRGDLTPKKPNDTPGPYHAYTLSLGNTKLSVVWDPTNQRFITAHNLKHLAEPTRLGTDVEGWLKTRDGQKIEIEEPTGYGSQNKIWGTIRIDADAVKPIPGSTYTPAIPILAEPRTFMALVPADRALDIVSKINEKYEREMGKVRNRLPLHLGVVFAPYKTPLRAIMDTGRRMLKQTAPVDGWEVTKKECLTADAGSLPGDLCNDPHFTEYVRLELTLEKQTQNERNAVWNVPCRMGDGSTPDCWYPYVFLKQDGDGNTPNDRNRMFEAPCPWNPDSEGNPQLTWLVHAKDLRCRDVDENGNTKAGDMIYFTPATVDFQWLDTSGRRFEIAYGDKGRRRGIPQRPYLSNEFETLRKIWDTLSSHLTSTQIHALRELIATKMEEWGDSTDPVVFRKFCRNAITNVEWKKHNGKYPWALDGKTTKPDWLDDWAGYAVRGWLDDTIELYMQIMKEQPNYEKERSL